MSRTREKLLEQNGLFPALYQAKLVELLTQDVVIAFCVVGSHAINFVIEQFFIGTKFHGSFEESFREQIY